MRVFKKIFIGVITIILLLVVLNFGLSYWITKKLPSIIEDEKDFPYSISYSDLDINILSGSFTMHDAYLVPKDSIAATVKNGIFGQIRAVGVRGLNIWQLLRHNRIMANTVFVDHPDIIIYHREKKYNVESDIEKPFRHIVQADRLEITEGTFKMLDTTLSPMVKAANINFELNHIRADSTTLDENLPVRYRDYRFSCDSLFYNAGQFYNITANRLATSDSTLAMENLRLIPKHSRKQFNSIITEEKDQFTIKAKKITIPKADWGFLRDTLYVHSPEVVLEQVNANIYRGKMVKDDPTTKKMYSELLRSIKFDLKVEKLLLKNSLVEYEEQLTYERPAAKVSFSRFYATISNIYSPVNKKELPPTTIDVQCLFMKAAPLKVNWSFNSLNTADYFTINGTLSNIKSEAINPVTQPLMNVTTKGDIKEVQFEFSGNRNTATGTFAINYDDLKVDIYKKDGKDKNKFMTAVGNLLVKSDSKGELKETTIATERLKDKSFFNFLWRCVQDGLKQTVLPKIISGGDADTGKKKKKK